MAHGFSDQALQTLASATSLMDADAYGALLIEFIDASGV